MYKHTAKEAQKVKLMHEHRVLRSELELINRLRTMRRALRYTSAKKQLKWYQIEIEYLQEQLRAWQDFRQDKL